MNPRILVVDDEAEMVAVLQRHLESEDRAVTATSSGTEALGVLERELSHGQDYVLGAELSLADFFILPSTFAFSLTEEGRKLYPKFPAFCRWRERMENLPTTKKLRAILPPREPIAHARDWANSHRPKY